MRESLPSWREAAEARGFGILCIRDPEGERFMIAAADAAKAARLSEQGLRPGALVPEAVLRAQLAQAGLSEADVEQGIQLAREWATTITRARSSKSPLPFRFSN